MPGKIKVIGYAQRTFFNNNIEYRNFSDDLVGQQLTSDGGTPLFTSGSFVVTTNMDSRVSKTFKTNKFSKFTDLNSLELTNSQISHLNDNIPIKLNLNRGDLKNYAYFGSLREFIRVSLEHVISNWPASIYVSPRVGTSTGYTIEDYTYNSINDKATFKTNTYFLRNLYDIKILTNAKTVNDYTDVDDTRNLTVNYNNYVISGSSGEFNILGYTGATSNNDDYLYFEVDGNPFTGSTTFKTDYFHIKPNSNKVNEFFNLLPEFESYLLNRQTIPTYTSRFTHTIKTDAGISLETESKIIWPTTDGYNLDFNTTQYIYFVSELLKLADDSDSIKTNIISRFLVSNSITDFDTIDKDSYDETGQKIGKLLKIYGREFDEIKRFSDGIALCNTVTYNKQDNTPDSILKMLGRTLGWELTTSLEENDFITSYLTPKTSTYSGETFGLTPIEAEIEMWRRIILNTPWIWKSKGTRKAIEFFIKFIGAPNGLIRFNEHLYVADNNLDIDEFIKILEINTGTQELTNIPISIDGYPKTLPDNSNMYFQKGGLWYRQTGGPNSDIDILGGNNPHIGPYDGGNEYINQFRCLIPNFSSTTLIEETMVSSETNLFSNYNMGIFNDMSDNDVYIDILDNNNNISTCFEISTNIIDDPCPSGETTVCGCEIDDSSLDKSIKIDIKKKVQVFDCGYISYEVLPNNYILFTMPNNTTTEYISPECCQFLGYTPESPNSCESKCLVPAPLPPEITCEYINVLYNWYTIDTDILAPEGYHVATQEEWETFENYLIVNGYNYDDTTSTSKVNKSLAFDDCWLTSSFEGAPGNTDYQEKRNVTGFSALPSGSRNNSGIFSADANTQFRVWTSSEYNSTNAKFRLIDVDEVYIQGTNVNKNYGYSVRCIKNDNIEPISRIIYDIDGNEYGWIKIGDQIWLDRSLAVTRYNDGSIIPKITDNTEWSNLTSGAYCIYNNE